MLFGAQTTSWEMRPASGDAGVRADAACVDLEIKALSAAQVQVRCMSTASYVPTPCSLLSLSAWQPTASRLRAVHAWANLEQEASKSGA